MLITGPPKPSLLVKAVGAIAILNLLTAKNQLKDFHPNWYTNDDTFDRKASLDLLSQDIAIYGSDDNLTYGTNRNFTINTTGILHYPQNDEDDGDNSEDGVSDGDSNDKGASGTIGMSLNSTNKNTEPIDSYYLSFNEYRKNRKDVYDSWFKPGTDVLADDADKNGTVLDFVIAGFPKCGTTTMSANLAYLAPMPHGDVCLRPSQIVYHSYYNWPKEFGNDKLLRGSKCPQTISDTVRDYSKLLPRTKVIIGIRHPILWFASFWNMLRANNRVGYRDLNTPYSFTKPCTKWGCRGMCPHKQILCLHRGRFHLDLAKLGKTALNEDERKLLAPNDRDGGENLKSSNIRNQIFIYEQSELDKDYIWDGLAKYLNVTSIPHDKYHGSHGKKKVDKINFCDKEYDNFRAMMMPYAYELSVWLEDYFIPVAKNESSDVTIPNPDVFTDLIKKYRNDPCSRLYRINNGTYILNDNITTVSEIAQG